MLEDIERDIHGADEIKQVMVNFFLMDDSEELFAITHPQDQSGVTIPFQRKQLLSRFRRTDPRKNMCLKIDIGGASSVEGSSSLLVENHHFKCDVLHFTPLL
ncbi:hypothetical protein D3C87_1236650 [compost metagenome]